MTQHRGFRILSGDIPTESGGAVVAMRGRLTVVAAFQPTEATEPVKDAVRRTIDRTLSPYILRGVHHLN